MCGGVVGCVGASSPNPFPLSRRNHLAYFYVVGPSRRNFARIAAFAACCCLLVPPRLTHDPPYTHNPNTGVGWKGPDRGRWSGAGGASWRSTLAVACGAPFLEEAGEETDDDGLIASLL